MFKKILLCALLVVSSIISAMEHNEGESKEIRTGMTDDEYESRNKELCKDHNLLAFYTESEITTVMRHFVKNGNGYLQTSYVKNSNVPIRNSNDRSHQTLRTIVNGTISFDQRKTVLSEALHALLKEYETLDFFKSIVFNGGPPFKMEVTNGAIPIVMLLISEQFSSQLTQFKTNCQALLESTATEETDSILKETEPRVSLSLPPHMQKYLNEGK